MHHPVRKVSRRASFTKAVVLTALLVVALFLYHRVTRYGIPKDFFLAPDRAPADPSRLMQFTEEQKDSVKRLIAGFWAYDDGDADSGALRLSDRIELKDNGIIWRVTVRDLRLPSGRRSRIVSVSHAYIHPFGRMKDNERLLVCEARVMREAVIRDNDTCFGTDNVDDVWNIEGDGTSFRFEDRHYRAYRGDVRTFFPPAAIDVIELAFGKQGAGTPVEQWAKLRKKDGGLNAPTGIFAMKKCEGGIDGVSLVRAAVAADCASSPAAAAGDAGSMAAVIGAYYRPYCLMPVLQRCGGAYGPTTLTVTARVGSDGGVKAVEVKFPRGRAVDRALAAVIQTEVGMWKFGAAAGGGEITVPFEVGF